MSAPVNVGEYAELAAAKVDPKTWCYFEGGAGDEVTLRANTAAYGRWRFRPRMLVDVSEVSTATTVLGTPVSMPLGIAPFAMQRLLQPEGECATARAATAANVLMTVSTLTTCTHAEIREASEGPRWLQLYILRDRERTLEHIAEAREAGYAAVVLTVDLPYVGRRERDLRLGFENPPSDLALPYASLFETTPALTWRDLEWIRAETGLPLVVKGILTREDALLAHQARRRRPEGAGARRSRRLRGPRRRLRTRGLRRGGRTARAHPAPRGDRARARAPRVHVAGSGDACPRRADRPL